MNWHLEKDKIIMGLILINVVMTCFFIYIIMDSKNKEIQYNKPDVVEQDCPDITYPSITCPAMNCQCDCGIDSITMPYNYTNVSVKK